MNQPKSRSLPLVTAEMVQAFHDRFIEGATYINENSAEFALYREALQAALRAAPLSETGPSWKLSDADIMSVIFHDPDENVTCYCMVNGALYETTVTLPAFVPQSERPRPTLTELMPDTNADGSYTYRPKRRSKGDSHDKP